MAEKRKEIIKNETRSTHLTSKPGKDYGDEEGLFFNQTPKEEFIKFMGHPKNMDHLSRCFFMAVLSLFMAVLVIGPGSRPWSWLSSWLSGSLALWLSGSSLALGSSSSERGRCQNFLNFYLPGH